MAPVGPLRKTWASMRGSRSASPPRSRRMLWTSPSVRRGPKKPTSSCWCEQAMNDTDQPSLPGLAASPEVDPLSLLPVAGREGPAVWVSKLAVYKSWPPSPDSLLRQVFELRLGLNILRASATGATNEASRLAGHGAGKTTFC